MAIKKTFRRFPICHYITEFQFLGKNFFRQRIVYEIEKLREQIPNKQILVLLPYESWKPGTWFGDGEDISLFSLLDHYDESQIPEGEGDPISYDRFILYMTDPPALSGGCNPKRDNGMNDCLYQYLYYAYRTFPKCQKL